MHIVYSSLFENPNIKQYILDDESIETVTAHHCLYVKTMDPLPGDGKLEGTMETQFSCKCKGSFNQILNSGVGTSEASHLDFPEVRVCDERRNIGSWIVGMTLTVTRDRLLSGSTASSANLRPTTEDELSPEFIFSKHRDLLMKEAKDYAKKMACGWDPHLSSMISAIHSSTPLLQGLDGYTIGDMLKFAIWTHQAITSQHEFWKEYKFYYWFPDGGGRQPALRTGSWSDFDTLMYRSYNGIALYRKGSVEPVLQAFKTSSYSGPCYYCVYPDTHPQCKPETVDWTTLKEIIKPYLEDCQFRCISTSGRGKTAKRADQEYLNRVLL